jgi:hypothetical protein
MKGRRRRKMSSRYWHTKSTRADKLTWLLNNQHLWEGWADIGDPRQKDLVMAMKREGLVSSKTNWSDINLTSLITEARKIRREGKK